MDAAICRPAAAAWSVLFLAGCWEKCVALALLPCYCCFRLVNARDKGEQTGLGQLQTRREDEDKDSGSTKLPEICSRSLSLAPRLVC
ncbi:hypothetical protein IWX91DRAFT_349905 [Phyllosticta citricarpa]